MPPYTSVDRELTSRWENLIGIGFESTFGTYAAPTLWLPCAEVQPIEQSQELLKVQAPLGHLLPVSSHPDVFGLNKGKCKVTIPALPYLNSGISELLSIMLCKVTTTPDASPPPYAHALELYNVAGKALSMDGASVTLEKINGAYTERLTGCRPVSVKFSQKQNKPLEVTIEFEGCTYSRNAVGALAPSITFSDETHPYALFSDLAFYAGPSENLLAVTEFEFELKLKATTSDDQQPLGTAARSRLDLVGVDSITGKFKRAFAYDDADAYRSAWEDYFQARTAVSLKAVWTGPTVSGGVHSYDVELGYGQKAAPDLAISGYVMEHPKVTQENGVVTEEVTVEVKRNPEAVAQAGMACDGIYFVVRDASATPATRP